MSRPPHVLSDLRREILRLLDEDAPDPAPAALLVGADAFPGSDPRASVARLDAWAAHIARSLEGLPPAVRRDAGVEAEALRSLLFGPRGPARLRGDVDALRTPDGTYLHRVLEAGVGGPLALSIVWVSVARRAGLAWSVVSLPAYPVVRRVDADLFADPFQGGEESIAARLPFVQKRVVGLAPDSFPPEALAPVGARAVVLRMIRNLWAQTTDGADPPVRRSVEDLARLTGVVPDDLGAVH